jgi:hypothetical protein
MPSVMEKTNWERKACGCIKTDLARAGRVIIRCRQHLGKPIKKSGRMVCHFDEAGIVRVFVPEAPIESCRVTLRKKQGFVYFARLGDLIKVGHSTNPKQRAASLSADLIGFVPGTPEREAALHSTLGEFRVRNEWYRGDAELLSIVDKLLAPK